MKNENYIIGCLLIKGKLATSLLDCVDHSYFTDKANVQFIKLVEEFLKTENTPLSISSIKIYCEKKNYPRHYIDDVVGYMDEVDTTVNFFYSVKTLIEKKQKLDYHQAVKKYITSDQKNTAEETLIKDFEAVQKKYSYLKTEFTNPNDVEANMKSGGLGYGIGITGFNVVKNRNGAVTVVAARTSEGKTTFMLNSLMQLVLRNPEKSFVFYSFEEEVKFIYSKLFLIYVALKNHNDQLFSGESSFYNSWNTLLKRNHSEYYEPFRKLFIDKRIVLVGRQYSITELKKSIFNYTSVLDVGSVYVDYIQKISYPIEARSRLEGLQLVSAGVLSSAIKSSVPIIVGAQVNREGISGAPSLGYIRECGDIEQDANTVIFLRKSEVDLGGVMSINAHVLKNREGIRDNFIELMLDGQRLLFTKSKVYVA